MNKNKEINYLGVRVSTGVSLKNSMDFVSELIKKGSSKLYTVNPEFIVDAFFDANFKKELNSSSLNIIDGVGLLYGIKKYFKKELSAQELENLKTLPGVDLVESILKLADEKGYSVFILGGNPEKDVSNLVIKNIKSNFPNIKLIGGSSEFTYETQDDFRTIEFIKSSLKSLNLKEVDILLVGYGHKNQEFWIGRNSYKIPARLSIGVGGTLDYLAGVVKRAPKFMRKIGFEWLYRLLTQPYRFFRILKATIIFTNLSSKFLRNS